MQRTAKGYVDYEDRDTPKAWKRPKPPTVGTDPQGDLLAPVVPAARVTDPETSNSGIADVLSRSGSQQYRLLLAYGSRPLGLIAEQAAEIAGLNVPGCCYWKRISEMLAEGLLEDTFKVQQASTGSSQRILALSARGRRAIG